MTSVGKHTIQRIVEHDDDRDAGDPAQRKEHRKTYAESFIAIPDGPGSNGENDCMDCSDERAHTMTTRLTFRQTRSRIKKPCVRTIDPHAILDITD